MGGAFYCMENRTFEMKTITDARHLLKHIGNELTLLWWQMDAWQEFFEIEQEKRKQIIQQTAPGFFVIVQVTLAESILLRICRLMDPPKSCGKENSSLQHFHQILAADSTFNYLANPINQIIDEWKKDKGCYDDLHLARNKWLAHNDFEQRSSLSAE